MAFWLSKDCSVLWKYCKTNKLCMFFIITRDASRVVGQNLRYYPGFIRGNYPGFLISTALHTRLVWNLYLFAFWLITLDVQIITVLSWWVREKFLCIRKINSFDVIIVYKKKKNFFYLFNDLETFRTRLHILWNTRLNERCTVNGNDDQCTEFYHQKKYI
jgi:hypothetical protein